MRNKEVKGLIPEEDRVERKDQALAHSLYLGRKTRDTQKEIHTTAAS